MQKKFFRNIKQSVATLIPVYEGNGGLAEGEGAGVTLSYPTIVNANDILIIQVLDKDADSFQTPTGFNGPVRSHTDNSNLSDALWWKRASGSESGTITLNSNSSDGDLIAAVMSRFSGCIQSGNPYEQQGSTGISSSTAIGFRSITTQGANRLILYLAQVNDDVIVNKITNATIQYQLTTSTGGGGAIQMHTRSAITTGSYNASAGTFNPTSTNYWGSFTLALIAA